MNEETTMSLQLKCVEFVGGPLDGYLEVIDPENIRCTDMIRLTINENIVMAIGGEQPGPKRPPTSVVYYERTLTNDEYRYYYLGSTYPSEPHNVSDWV
jgi:hypothetical protein